MDILYKTCWVAGEVSGITGGTAIFCIPAQQTIPLLVRWMLVLEDSDDEKLYFAKGPPRECVTSGKEIKIQQAPTRWGRVDFDMQAAPGEEKYRFSRNAGKNGFAGLKFR